MACALCWLVEDAPPPPKFQDSPENERLTSVRAYTCLGTLTCLGGLHVLYYVSYSYAHAAPSFSFTSFSSSSLLSRAPLPSLPCGSSLEWAHQMSPEDATAPRHMVATATTNNLNLASQACWPNGLWPVILYYSSSITFPTWYGHKATGAHHCQRHMASGTTTVLAPRGALPHRGHVAAHRRHIGTSIYGAIGTWQLGYIVLLAVSTILPGC